MNKSIFYILLLMMSCKLLGRELPPDSSLVTVNNHSIHIHKKGSSNNGTLVILLSGPTDNWHSDSAWWALAQNYLAVDYATVAIDRAGQAWSQTIENPSYRQFAKDLEGYLKSQSQDFVFVAFASSNLALHSLLHNKAIAEKTKGAVLIDPDVLTEHSIKHYSTDSEGYRQRFESLKEYIESGKYDERIKQKIAAEKKHILEIIPQEFESFMDWEYYHAIESLRVKREYQVNKFKETTVYLKDLQHAKAKPLPTSIPLVIIDTDFESGYLETIKEDSVKESITQWRKDGIEWYFSLAKKSQCGAYWPVETREHLLPMEQPQLIKRGIEQMMKCP